MCLRRPLAPKNESDDWVFDTIKAPALPIQQYSQKRRKCSAPSNGALVYSEAFGRLDLNAAPPTDVSPPSQPPTVRKALQPKRLSISGAPPSQAGRTSAQRQPLGADLSFGNGASTVRQFRRVSEHPSIEFSDGSPAGRDENHSPSKDVMSKEAKLGRRAYVSAIDGAFQETHAQTGSQAKREAIARVASAWEALDMIDPEGEYQLLRSMIGRMQRYISFSFLFLFIWFRHDSLASSPPTTHDFPWLTLIMEVILDWPICWHPPNPATPPNPSWCSPKPTLT